MKKFITTLLLSTFVLTAWAQIVPTTESLFVKANKDIQGKTPSVVHKENLDAYKKFVKMDVDTYTDNNANMAQFLAPHYAQEVFETASNNPVVSLYKYNKYDPTNKGIGFCFGRAMFVHLELMQRKFDRDSIKKAFVVGPMETPDGGSWGWHVTTIAQSKDSKGKEIWLAIDPIAGVLELTKWYNLMRNDYSTDKKLKLYITTSGRLGAGTSTYEETLKTEKFYNNYFKDMMNWFDKESRKTDRYAVPLTEM